jgi:hypothetical protein
MNPKLFRGISPSSYLLSAIPFRFAFQSKVLIASAAFSTSSFLAARLVEVHFNFHPEADDPTYPLRFLTGLCLNNVRCISEVFAF